MGACFVEQTFPKSDEATLKSAYSDMHECLTNEHGTGSFNGTFATCRDIRILPDKFDSRDLAFDKLQEIIEKRGNALAVKVLVQPTLTDAESQRSREIRSEQFSIAKALSKLRMEDEDALAAIKGAKSERISCQTCKSSIARRFLRQTKCPVCGADDLRSNTQKATHERRIARAESQLEKTIQAFNKIHVTAAKRVKPDNWEWYVCGLAGS